MRCGKVRGISVLAMGATLPAGWTASWMSRMCCRQTAGNLLFELCDLAGSRDFRSHTPRGNTVKIKTKGQVTIPIEIRETLGLLPDSEVEFEIVGTSVRMRKVRKTSRSGRRGKSIVGRMRGRGSTRMSTEEILALTRGDG